MRRKLSPTPIARPTTVRPLSAAFSGSRLPTVAALAVALASMACASNPDDVRPDPVAAKAPLVVPSTTAAPSDSGPGLNVIDPEPHELAGEPAIVTPPPVASASAKPKHVPAVPTIKHRTAGVPPRVKPGSPYI